MTAKTQPPATTGKFPKTDFVIDPDTPTATCPAGHTTTHAKWNTDKKGRRVRMLRFPAEICNACRVAYPLHHQAAMGEPSP